MKGKRKRPGPPPGEAEDAAPVVRRASGFEPIPRRNVRAGVLAGLVVSGICSIPVAVDAIAHGKPDNLLVAGGVGVITFFMTWLFVMGTPGRIAAGKEWIVRGGEANPFLVEDHVVGSMKAETPNPRREVIDAHWPKDVRERVIRLLSLVPAAAAAGSVLHPLLVSGGVSGTVFLGVFVGAVVVWAASVFILRRVFPKG